jgi:hypothetical protein
MRVKVLLAGLLPVFVGIFLNIYCMPWIEAHHSGWWTKPGCHGVFWMIGFLLAGCASAWLARGRVWSSCGFWALIEFAIIILLNFVEPYETLSRFDVPTFQEGWKWFLFLSLIVSCEPLWAAVMVEHFRGPEVSSGDLASDATDLAESITNEVQDHFHHL